MNSSSSSLAVFSNICSHSVHSINLAGNIQPQSGQSFTGATPSFFFFLIRIKNQEKYFLIYGISYEDSRFEINYLDQKNVDLKTIKNKFIESICLKFAISSICVIEFEKKVYIAVSYLNGKLIKEYVKYSQT